MLTSVLMAFAAWVYNRIRQFFLKFDSIRFGIANQLTYCQLNKWQPGESIRIDFPITTEHHTRNAIWLGLGCVARMDLTPELNINPGFSGWNTAKLPASHPRVPRDFLLYGSSWFFTFQANNTIPNNVLYKQRTKYSVRTQLYPKKTTKMTIIKLNHTLHQQTGKHRNAHAHDTSMLEGINK